MSNFDVFRSYCADWAQGVEILSAYPFKGEHREIVEIGEDTAGLAVAILNPDTDRLLSADDYELTVKDPNQEEVHEEQNDEKRFAFLYQKRLTTLDRKSVV